MLQLVLAGVGTFQACRRVGIGRETGYRWRAEHGGLPSARPAGWARSNRYLSHLEWQWIATCVGRDGRVRDRPSTGSIGADGFEMGVRAPMSFVLVVGLVW